MQNRHGGEKDGKTWGEQKEKEENENDKNEWKSRHKDNPWSESPLLPSLLCVRVPDPSSLCIFV